MICLLSENGEENSQILSLCKIMFLLQEVVFIPRAYFMGGFLHHCLSLVSWANHDWKIIGSESCIVHVI